MSGPDELIWTGNWHDAREFIARVGYAVPFLGEPAIYLCDGGPLGCNRLHVRNDLTLVRQYANIGDKVRWYRSTRTFGVVRDEH